MAIMMRMDRQARSGNYKMMMIIIVLIMLIMIFVLVIMIIIFILGWIGGPAQATIR